MHVTNFSKAPDNLEDLASKCRRLNPFVSYRKDQHVVRG